MTTHYRCMLDFVQHWHISPERFASWHGRALILESALERDRHEQAAEHERRGHDSLHGFTAVDVVVPAGVSRVASTS